jgi:hypothetical protein
MSEDLSVPPALAGGSHDCGFEISDFRFVAFWSSIQNPHSQIPNRVTHPLTQVVLTTRSSYPTEKLQL